MAAPRCIHHYSHNDMIRSTVFALLWWYVAICCGACGVFCESKKGTTRAACNHVGTLVDYRELDGCQWLIRLDDGRLLLPQRWPEGFAPVAGQRIRFGFEEVLDLMTICMAEDVVVRLTCLEAIADTSRPQPLPCLQIDDPFEVDWLNKALERYNPHRVVRYPWRDGWVYLLEGQQQWALYDCQGTLLCTTMGDSEDRCHLNYLNLLRTGKVIWVGEGIWD